LFPTEITYIKQPLEEMADETITILDHLITDYKSLEKTKILSTQIIEGKSIK
jgi:LacI family transcriptional regulator